MAAKRSLPTGQVADGRIDKKSRHSEQSQMYNKIATAENAATVDKNPPLGILLQAVADGVEDVGKGSSVVYWMRMEDLRSAYRIKTIPVVNF